MIKVGLTGHIRKRTLGPYHPQTTAIMANNGRWLMLAMGRILAFCCLSPWQLLVDSCLFFTEEMIDNVRIQEVIIPYAAFNYLQIDNVC
jgi:hypothetical protein